MEGPFGRGAEKCLHAHESTSEVRLIEHVRFFGKCVKEEFFVNVLTIFSQDTQMRITAFVRVNTGGP
jgi:hypothetical protein